MFRLATYINCGSRALFGIVMYIGVIRWAMECRSDRRHVLDLGTVGDREPNPCRGQGVSAGLRDPGKTRGRQPARRPGAYLIRKDNRLSPVEDRI